LTNLIQINQMSARAPVGASARSELFTARSDAGEGKYDHVRGNAEEKVADDEVNEEDAGPLQMQHMTGYAGDYRQTVLAAARDENMYIKRLGCCPS
jgi:hypothetical protein